MRSIDERRLREEKYDGVESQEFFADCERLARGEPLAYVIGWQPFLGLKILLDSHPLIPRPETEWWTEQLLIEAGRRISGVTHGLTASSAPEIRGPSNFLDLCAGSGAIGCAALKQLSGANVYFGDIDPSHEATIRKNIRENKLEESRADIRIGDLFAPFAGITFNIVAANPPYIPEGRALDASVRDFEPHQALFSGTDGLGVIERIAEALPSHLAKDGVAWIECDSEHAGDARALFEAQGLASKIRTDQYGNPRVFVVSFP